MASGTALFINNQLVNPNDTLTIGNTNANGQVAAALKTFKSGSRTIRAYVDQAVIAQSHNRIPAWPCQREYVRLSRCRLCARQWTINYKSYGHRPGCLQQSDSQRQYRLEHNGSAVVTPANQTTNSQGKATAQVVDSIVEQVTVSATVDSVLLNNQATLTFTGADMVLSAATVSEALADSTLAYNIKVRNIGGITMQGVSLQVQLPDLVTYTSQTSPVVPVQNGQTLTWNFGAFTQDRNVPLSSMAPSVPPPHWAVCLRARRSHLHYDGCKSGEQRSGPDYNNCGWA